MSTVAEALAAIPFRVVHPKGSLPYVEAEVKADFSNQRLTVQFYSGRPEFRAAVIMIDLFREIERRAAEAEKGLAEAREELDRQRRVIEAKDQQISGYANQLKGRRRAEA